MIAYLSGLVTEKDTERLVIEIGGIGYELIIHSGFASRLPAPGESGKVQCYLHVRDDIRQLYGFPGREEKELFLKLLTVTGIGPKVAMTIVGSVAPGQFALAVLAGDVKSLTAIRGIGKKTAERLILELRDAMKALRSEDDSLPDILIEGSDGASDALNGLMVLGYHAREAEQAVRAAKPGPDEPVEAIIRRALQVLARAREVR
jgi:Holliday junction DNA helicase RuvA